MAVGKKANLRESLRQAGLRTARTREYHRMLNILWPGTGYGKLDESGFGSQLTLLHEQLKSASREYEDNKHVGEAFGIANRLLRRMRVLRRMYLRMPSEYAFLLDNAERREESTKVSNFFKKALLTEFEKGVNDIKSKIHLTPAKYSGLIEMRFRFVQAALRRWSEQPPPEPRLNDLVAEDKQFEALRYLVTHGTLDGFKHLKHSN